MKNIFSSESRFNQVYMFFGNTVTVISGVIGFLSWLVGKIVEAAEKIPTTVSVVATYIHHFCVVLFVLGVICLITRIIYAGIKAKAESYYVQRKLAEYLYTQLVCKIRNNIVELEPLTDKLRKFEKENNVDAIKECYDKELAYLKANLKEYIDRLSEHLSQYRNSVISVCIKIFKKRDRNRDEFLTEEIISLVRSSNTEELRKSDKTTVIGQNTDFVNLCKGQLGYFGSSNLHKINEAGQYINDSENWKENKYTSTLVTPIRYNSSSDIENSKNIKSDIIGFLCIDSQDEIKEWEFSDSFELQMLFIFSALFYVYLKEFYKCFEDIGYKM